jgi:hypothetical protein
MKKTVQIVTIPLDKEGWNKGDLIKLISGYSFDGTNWCLAGRDKDSMVEGNFQAQQLLVLTDDEVSIGDVGKVVKYPWGIGRTIEHEGNQGIEVECITCTLINNPYHVTAGSKARFSAIDVYEIIASYPQIEDTLPISKEAIQAWIDAGTPEKGSIDMLYWCKNGDSLAGCEKQTHCNCSDNTEADIDSKGNLLLEFGKEYKNKGNDLGDLAERAIDKIIVNATNKPSIPTDEKIEKNSKDYAYAMKGQLYTEKGQHPADTAWSLLSRGYKDGYKQALKDLGKSK